MDKIYLVTMIQRGDPILQDGELWVDKKLMGWYKGIKEAVRAVESNELDICEGCTYDHCVIERVTDGVYPTGLKEWWYRWEGDERHGGYKPVPKPKGLENVANFGIG